MFLENPKFAPQLSRFRKQKAALLIRLQNEFSSLESTDQISYRLPNPEDLREIEIKISPGESSYWSGLHFIFSIEVPIEYPFVPPRVRCTQRPSAHPNFSETGSVCLNVAREDWTAAMDIELIAQGLLTLMYLPGLSEPLDQVAADEYAAWARSREIERE